MGLKYVGSVKYDMYHKLRYVSARWLHIFAQKRGSWCRGTSVANLLIYIIIIINNIYIKGGLKMTTNRYVVNVTGFFSRYGYGRFSLLHLTLYTSIVTNCNKTPKAHDFLWFLKVKGFENTATQKQKTRNIDYISSNPMIPFRNICSGSQLPLATFVTQLISLPFPPFTICKKLDIWL